MRARRTDSAVRRTKSRQDAAPVRRPVRAFDTPPASQQIWRGASGAPYIHTVSTLLFCPEMPESTYLLVRREVDGSARVLRVGSLENQAWSLNLAQIRQVGAALGANEVHIRPQAGSPAERARVAFDIEHALASSDEVLRAGAEAGKEHRLA